MVNKDLARIYGDIQNFAKSLDSMKVEKENGISESSDLTMSQTQSLNSSGIHNNQDCLNNIEKIIPKINCSLDASLQNSVWTVKNNKIASINFGDTINKPNLDQKVSFFFDKHFNTFGGFNTSLLNFKYFQQM